MVAVVVQVFLSLFLLEQNRDSWLWLWRVASALPKPHSGDSLPFLQREQDHYAQMKASLVSTDCENHLRVHGHWRRVSRQFD